MYDDVITGLIKIFPTLTTVAGMFVAFYFHIMKKIDERLEKERYCEDRKGMYIEFDKRFNDLKREIEIREEAKTKQLDRIEQSLISIQEHMINCNKRGIG